MKTFGYFLNIAVEELIDQNMDLFLEEDEVYELRATAMVSKEQQKAKDRENLKNLFLYDSMNKELVKAIRLIVHELPKKLEMEQRKKLIHELLSIGDYSSFLERIISLEDDSQEGTVSPVDLFKFGNESLLEIYKFACGFFNEGECDKAKSLLAFLIFVAPGVCSHWMGLGVCFRKEGNLEEAIRIFQSATSMFSERMEPRLALVECFLESKSDEKARAILKEAERVLHQQGDTKRWVKEIQDLKKQVNERKS